MTVNCKLDFTLELNEQAKFMIWQFIKYAESTVLTVLVSKIHKKSRGVLRTDIISIKEKKKKKSNKNVKCC